MRRWFLSFEIFSQDMDRALAEQLANEPESEYDDKKYDSDDEVWSYQDI